MRETDAYIRREPLTDKICGIRLAMTRCTCPWWGKWTWDDVVVGGSLSFGDSVLLTRLAVQWAGMALPKPAMCEKRSTKRGDKWTTRWTRT
jgi:hypothetical protein